jgi:hypothetical protein
MDPMVKAAKAARACARLGSCTCPFFKLGTLSESLVSWHSGFFSSSFGALCCVTQGAESPIPVLSPICPGVWMGLPSPICRGSGVRPHWHPQPRFAEITHHTPGQ